jgi:hypothetical protein
MHDTVASDCVELLAYNSRGVVSENCGSVEAIQL